MPGAALGWLAPSSRPAGTVAAPRCAAPVLPAATEGSSVAAGRQPARRSVAGEGAVPGTPGMALPWGRARMGERGSVSKAMAKIARMVTRFHVIERGTAINFPIKWGKRIRFAGCDQGWWPALPGGPDLAESPDGRRDDPEGSDSPAMGKTALLMPKPDMLLQDQPCGRGSSVAPRISPAGRAW